MRKRSEEQADVEVRNFESTYSRQKDTCQKGNLAKSGNTWQKAVCKWYKKFSDKISMNQILGKKFMELLLSK